MTLETANNSPAPAAAQSNSAATPPAATDNAAAGGANGNATAQQVQTPAAGEQAPAASANNPGAPAGAGGEAKKEGEQFLFDKSLKPGEKKDEGEKPADGQLTAADKRKYLTEKDPANTLDGKTDDEINQLYDAQKAKEAADADKPIEYQPFQVPDEMPIPAESLERFTGMAQKNKWTQEQAQTVIDEYVAEQNRQLDAWAATKQEWYNEIKSDKDLGGAHLAATQSTCNDVVRQFWADPKFGGSPDLLDSFQNDLMLLGIGSRISFVRGLMNIARHTKSDDISGTSGGSGGEQRKSTAEVLWPNMPPA